MKKLLPQLSCMALIYLAAISSSLADKQMDTFFAESKNQQAFEKASKAGLLIKGRKDMVKGCEKEKARRKKSEKSVDCDCVAKQMEKVSDKQFFYESIVSLQVYQETIKAMKAKDEKKIQQLKAGQANRNSLAKILNSACGL